MTKFVYLSGPISHFEHDRASKEFKTEVIDWRQRAKEELSTRGYKVFDPTVRVYRGNVEEIVEADIAELRESSLVLAYTPIGVPMTGTPMEVCIAAHLGIPVISFPPHRSPWFKYHTRQYDSLTDALGAAILALDYRNC